MKKQLLIIIAIATLVCWLTGCASSTTGKTAISIVKPVAKKLAEDELRLLIEDALK